MKKWLHCTEKKHTGWLLWQVNARSGAVDKANCKQNNQRKGDLKIKHCDKKGNIRTTEEGKSAKVNKMKG